MKRILRSISQHIKSLLLLSVDALLVLTGPKAARSNCVLVVRLDAIGDFVLWLDAAQALVRRYELQGGDGLVANATWASWAKNLELFDDVIPVDSREFQRDPWYRFRLCRSIQALGCALAIQPTYSRFWLLGDSVIHFSGAAERIGSTSAILPTALHGS